MAAIACLTNMISKFKGAKRFFFNTVPMKQYSESLRYVFLTIRCYPKLFARCVIDIVELRVGVSLRPKSTFFFIWIVLLCSFPSVVRFSVFPFTLRGYEYNLLVPEYFEILLFLSSLSMTCCCCCCCYWTARFLSPTTSNTSKRTLTLL